MASMHPLIGTRLGNYEIQSLIGSGGSAHVYRAFDHNLQRSVAIKMLSSNTASQHDFGKRFAQEARLVAQLNHPNIVYVYDYGQHDTYSYMVQELLPGPTLAEHLNSLRANGESLNRDAVLDIVGQLAAALDAAHMLGVIHRDVKPGNAMWNAFGALVLTDFGVAKHTQAAADQTRSSVIIGTPH